MENRIAEINFKRNFISIKKTLVFTDEGITLYRKKVKIIQFRKDEINDFRFGIYWIGRIDFYTGSIYRIDLRNKNKKTIKIKLVSPYGINEKKLEKKYSEILTILYDNYLKEIISTFIHRIEGGEQIEIAGILFTNDGVFLEPKQNIVLWHDLNAISTTYYYSLASKQKPEYFTYYKYFTDWNVSIVYGVSQGILKNKGLYKE
jgi:hypothetical protein